MGQFEYQEVDVGIGDVMVAQGLADGPMPVGAKAVPPSEPDSQEKPGKGRQRLGEKVPRAGDFRNPSEDIEKGEGGMWTFR
jgi:hypothetical protein